MTTITSVLENSVVAFLLNHPLWILYFYIFLSSFFVLFCAFATWTRMRADGDLSVFDYALLGPPALIGYVEDILFRFIIGTVLYMDFSFDTATFSTQTAKWQDDLGLRGVIARKVKSKLNKILPGHIH